MMCLPFSFARTDALVSFAITALLTRAFVFAMLFNLLWLCRLVLVGPARGLDVTGLMYHLTLYMDTMIFFQDYVT